MDRLLKFDYLTAASINKVIEELDSYRKEWKIDDRLSLEQRRELRHLAAVQSVGSSTRIEGSRLSDEEVAELIENLEIRQLTSRDEQEVAGYYSVLSIIHDMYRDLPITESTIKGLHNELMKHSTKDEFHRGRYKELSNQVVATDTDGNQRIIFKTTEPYQTPEAMRNAVEWFNREREKGVKHQLLLIAAFIYEFLTIHPFQDGNGRLSRLLTNLLLLQAGYEFVQYASLESVIEADKAGYYKALMMAQRYRAEDREEIGRWTYFLLNAIRRLTGQVDLDEKNILEEPAALYVNKRQRKVMEFLKEEDTLSVGEIDALLPIVSRNTLKYDLSKLTEAGLLERKGKGRGTVYSLKRKR